MADETCKPVTRCKLNNGICTDIGPLPGGPYPQRWTWTPIPGCTVDGPDRLDQICNNSFTECAPWGCVPGSTIGRLDAGDGHIWTEGTCDGSGLDRKCGIVAAVCLTLVGMHSTALAQDATPAGSLPVCVDVATPAVDAVLEEAFGWVRCRGRRLPRWRSPWGSAAGEPADAETVATADRVVQTWIACQLSGEALAVLALQSDQMDAAFAWQYWSDAVVYENMLDADLQATPVALDPDLMISSGQDVRILEDGRVGGIWSVNGDAAFTCWCKRMGLGWSMTWWTSSTRGLPPPTQSQFDWDDEKRPRAMIRPALGFA